VLPSLDPQNKEDWLAMRQQGHRMLDDMFDYLENLRERPVWQPAPDAVRHQFDADLPAAGQELAAVHDTFMQAILPYAIGNAHPGFMGWVHGAGTPVGMLAEMLAAGLNANVGGRNQVPVLVEQQILHWVRDLFGFPETASGLFVTGTSMANFIAVLVARKTALGSAVRHAGVNQVQQRLVAYTSVGAHGCIAQAMDLAGLGIDALRMIPMNDTFSMDVAKLQAAIADDLAQGYVPFMLIGTAGSVDVGAIDDLPALADIAQRYQLWFHIDGAYGALGMLSPTLRLQLSGLERADSVAFDFHKWGQVPYDAGFVIVRDGTQHYETFATPAAYLRREACGMAAGSPWPCDYGPDLSRGFRALKTWFTLQVYGADSIGASIAQTCELAQYLKLAIVAQPQLVLAAPVRLNIVCFRYAASDAVNAEIVVRLQLDGHVAPSTTTINGQLVIRVALVNHRAAQQDMDALVAGVLKFGAELTGADS
jgi:glutamate/tyrosine decarboxylase-like PLP-dependent enzyme